MRQIPETKAKTTMVVVTARETEVGGVGIGGNETDFCQNVIWKR